MSCKSSQHSWYALQVRSRWETSTASLLTAKGYQTFLPLRSREKQRRNALARVAASPLFPGYVFCQFDPFVRLPILVTPGVIAVVGSGRVPTPVAESEIEAIQTVVSSGLQAQPWPFLEIGEQVRIQTGALTGLSGFLVSFKGVSRIVVSVSLLCRSVAVEIDRSSVCPLRCVPPEVLRPLSFQPLLQGAAS